ncbi:MAG TPA: hypothetical protein VKH37_06475, partial [Ferruginibacter sp.]|nr:hypothetical protein [Ferruginibacter sp.]
MKRRIQFLLATVLAVSVVFIGCKKNDTSSSSSDDTALTTHSDDQSTFSQTTDDIANDGNDAIEASPAFLGKPGDANGTNGVTTLCHATATLDSTATLRRLTVIYNGLNCIGTRNRVGTVVFTMPLAQHWKDAGAVLTVNVQSLVITRVSDSKSLTINGTGTITNVSGGRLINLGQPGGPTSITHDIASAGVTVTFNDGTQRSWQISKRRVFTY